MKKFVVAYISFFDNVLQQEIVEAENNLEACKKYMLNISTGEWMENEKAFQQSEDFPKSYEEYQNYLFNADSTINALEI